MPLLTALKADFPILSRQVNGQPLAYLDNAATAQKPESVLAVMDSFYRQHNANIHRGVHTLAEEATTAYEEARDTIARFAGADPSEIIFTRSATEAINLVAHSWGRHFLAKGDAVLLTEMDHHANLVPWYLLAKELELELRFARVKDDGLLDEVDFARKLGGAKLAAFTHVSNVLGTINPVKRLTALAHNAGATVLIDAAQAVSQLPIDVTDTGADFTVWSGHKMFGPMGIGVLHAKGNLLKAMPPWLGGGEMIKEVGQGQVTFADPPQKFEAGTMPVAEAVGLAAACDYLTKLGMEAVREHEQSLSEYALKKFDTLSGVTMYGPADPAQRGGLVSFTVEGVHPHDLATILDEQGIAIRSGRHCAHPLHQRLSIAATARASWSIYNTTDDLDRLVTGIKSAQKTFSTGQQAARS